MEKRSFPGQMYRGAGASGLVGLGLLFTVIFAGVGIMLLGLSFLFFIIGAAGQALLPQTAPGLDRAKEQTQPIKR